MRENRLFTGVVLAGGKSRRMGRNKALLKTGEITFVQHVAETLRKACGDVCIIADDKAAYQFLSFPVYPDIYKNCGPLAGIHSAFVHTDSEFLFVASCDIPLVTETFLHRVRTHVKAEDAVVPEIHGQIHPLCAIYRRTVFQCMEDSLKNRNYSMKDFLAKIPARFVTLTIENRGERNSPLYNVNTPVDYKELLNNNRLAGYDYNY